MVFFKGTLILKFSSLFFLFHLNVLAQEIELDLRATKEDEIVLDRYLEEKSFLDSFQLSQTLQIVLEELRYDGYVLASFDSVEFDGVKVHSNFYLGKQYEWLKLDVGNINPDLLRKVDFEKRDFEGRKINLEDFKNLQERILSYSENNGYPFASIRLDSIQFDQSEISAQFNYQSGTYIQFDTLILNTGLKLNKRFLSNYLGFIPKTAFNQSKINQSVKTIENLGFLKLKSSPLVRFEYDKAFVEYDLEAVKSNQIDGFLGFLPNAQNNGRLQVTGQFLLNLVNPFGSGKKIRAEWQSFQRQSQKLSITYEHPSFLKTSFDLIGQFNLLRQDSTFSTTDFEIKARYNTRKIGRVSFVYRIFNSTVGNSLLANSVREDSLASFGQNQFNSYGIEYNWDNLDNPFQPKRGWKIFNSIGIGSKEVNLLQIDSLNQEKIPNSTQYILRTSLSKYFKLGKQATLVFQANGGKIFNDQLFLNDLFRIGGLRTLRGFNENEFFVSQYFINIIEARIYFEQNSFVFLHSDFGFIENEVNQTSDFPMGIGAGLTFSTKTGIFSLVYSLGQANNQNFNPSRSKIHFGLTSRF